MSCASDQPQRNRTLRKMVPTYFARMRSPSYISNRPRGRRHVRIDTSVVLGRDYAGRRSFTPGFMEARGSGLRPSLDSGRKPVDRCEGRQMMFSSFYRPHIRVTIRKDAEVDLPRRKLSRVRKPVVGLSNAACSLSGPLVVLENENSRRIRKEHPQISSRMRQGNGMGDILQGQKTGGLCSRSSC